MVERKSDFLESLLNFLSEKLPEQTPTPTNSEHAKP
jgi:hypothetical protein